VALAPDRGRHEGAHTWSPARTPHRADGPALAADTHGRPDAEEGARPEPDPLCVSTGVLFRTVQRQLRSISCG